METITFDKDIKVFYVKAASFPAGVIDAHNSLHALVPFSKDRKYFGISRPENRSGIVYSAAAEEACPGEAEKYNFDTLILKKGSYNCISIPDFKKDPESIGNAFKELLMEKNIDPQGYCVEWYMNDHTSVKCMIRLKD